ncbi:MAG TPA: crossover junction endodeoxyribonuclease RuvC [Dehalococcoidia bacterium]|nr:crossover junction endodeoxyribonuclease RuvC [Dehalococcoidia bacterium]
MRVLGIDPGTVVIGYGVIDSDGDRTTLVDYGALSASTRLPVGERLGELYNQLQEIVSRYGPDAVAVEQPFVARNAKSALAIGKAQAVAILVAVNRGIPTFEYTPAQIKRQVANYGASSKEQVQRMVSLQLGLSEVPQPDDAADALATALCHLGEAHVENLLAEEK